jgi:hypothetical protein
VPVLFLLFSTYGFFILRTAIVNLLLSVSLDSDVLGRADTVVTSSVRSLRQIRTRGPEKAGSATTVRPATDETPVWQSVGNLGLYILISYSTIMIRVRVPLH